MKGLWLLLAIVAAARLLMQNAALPPYAGLDEVYHVARFAFVAQEGRNPRIDEKSIPPYIARSIDGQPDFAPAWPARTTDLRDRRLAPEDRRPYTAPNYEAQHPSLYYSLAAPLAASATQLDQLRALRLLSVFFALVTVLATAFIGMRVAGPYGMLAGALLVAIPTWQTLVLRASNDAFACAAIAVAFAISFTAPKTRGGWIAESLVWAIALSVKLYAWPASVGVFTLWFAQRAPWRRRFTVMGVGAIAVALTVVDLASRTRNALGILWFDPTHAGGGPPIRWVEVAKITIASFAWTSGPHWNAMTPLAIALYLGPILLIGVLSVFRWSVLRTGERSTDARLLGVVLATALAFGAAQVVNAVSDKTFSKDGLPGVGKEGWYWYALAPVGIVAVSLALKHAPRALAVFAVAWIVGWDVLITEGALFQDYAGITSAAHGDALFRWGGRALPFTYSLGHVAVGPLTGIVTELRVVYLIATAALTAVILSRWPLAGRPLTATGNGRPAASATENRS